MPDRFCADRARLSKALSVKEAKLTARSHTDRRFGRAELVAGVRGLGDSVLVHSSLRSLGYVEGRPIAVFEALWDAIGPDGTMIVHTTTCPGARSPMPRRTRTTSSTRRYTARTAVHCPRPRRNVSGTGSSGRRVM